MSKYTFLLALCICKSLEICAQTADSSSKEILKNLNLSGYLEMYVAVDDDDNNKHQRPNYLYNNTRTGELALNLGLLKATWSNATMRGNMALMAGTYAQRNLATEAEIFQHVYEANVGLKISKKRNWWLDMGILNSHIGLESALGKDNPTLTRSLAAENSPYYETGFRASYTSPNSKFYFAGFLLNGWQRIYKLDGDYLPAIGVQTTWKPNKKWIINYSNYLGDESVESDFGPRFFNNLFVTYAPNEKLTLHGAYDFGMQPDFSDDDWPMQQWASWFAIAKWNMNKKCSAAARVEKYNDPNEVIVTNYYDDGFVAYGFSFNVDYKINEHALFRIEGRRFQTENDAFENRNGDLRNTYDGLTACLAVSL